MKNLLAIGILISSSNVFASKMVNINSMTNPVLESVSTEIAKSDLVTHSGLKKVLVLKGNGKNEQEVRANAVAQAMHTLCGFFDEGVSVGLDEKSDKGAKDAVDTLTDNSQNSEDESYTKLVEAVKKANKQIGVEVYSGSAGGNNTFGNVLGFYDVKNNEIAAFASTNCGSDD